MRTILSPSKFARKKRGFILVVALFFLMLLAFIGTALVGLLPLEFRSTSRNQLDVQAHYAAAAGIRYAADWFTAVISKYDGSSALPPHWAVGDLPDHGVTWGNSNFNGGIDIMSVPSNNNDWELLRLRDLKFPKTGYSYIPPSHNASFGQTGNALCGYVGMADAPSESNTWVVASKRPLKLSNDWDVWVAFVPHNDQDTPGSEAWGPNTNDVIANSRAYQMVSIAVYQGQPYLRAKAMLREETTAKFARLIGSIPDPDDSASGSFNVSGASFELGAASANKVLYEGPVHSNSYLPLSIQPAVWNSTQGSQPFQGVLSYSQPFAMPGGWNQDDVRWAAGNYGAFNADRRPFAGENDPSPVAAPAGTRYDALIRNGKANLQQTKTVAFPPDTANLYDAAFGRDSSGNVLTDVNSMYVNKTTLPAVASGAFGNIYDGSGNRLNDASGNPVKPQGIFVNTDSSGTALGGIYINGDVKAMMLEAMDNNGVPITSPSTLATASQNTFNAGIRAQDQKISSRPITITDVTTATTKTTTRTTSTSLNTGTTTTTNFTTSTSFATVTGNATTTNRTPISTTTSFTTGTTTNLTTNRTGTSTSFSTSTTTNRTTNFSTSFSTSTSLAVTTNLTRVTTFTTTSNFVSDADGSGNSGWVRTTNALTTTTTSFSTATNRTTSTSTTPVSTSTSTSPVVTTSFSTAFSTTTSTNLNTTSNRTTNFSTATNVGPATVTSSSFSTTSNRATSTGVTPVTSTTRSTATSLTTATAAVTMEETWRAIDRALLPNATGGVTIGTNLNMNTTNFSRSPGGVSSNFQMDMSNASSMRVIDGKTGAALTAATNIGTNQIAILKQSRTNPNEVYLFVVSKNTDPKYKDGTNGAVFVDGNVNGLGGVNINKRTLATRNDSTKQSDISIADNIVQIGVTPGNKPPNHLNGLGMIANNVNIVAQNGDFGDLTTNPLQIYSIILAGKASTDGGMRVKRNYDPVPTYYVGSSTSPDPAFMAKADKDGNGTISAAEWRALKILAPGASATYNSSSLNLVNDFNTNFDMNYLLGNYRTWQSSTPFFHMYGGLLERQPRIIYNGGTTSAGWKSAFSYDQELANNPPPFWPSTGTPEIVSYQEERL